MNRNVVLAKGPERLLGVVDGMGWIEARSVRMYHQEPWWNERGWTVTYTDSKDLRVGGYDHRY